jgi:hypothetical protein
MIAPLSASASGAQLVRPRAMLRRCASACLHRSGRLRVHAAPLRAPLRCFAAQRNEGDAANKSWSELAGEAAGLAKCAPARTRDSARRPPSRGKRRLAARRAALLAAHAAARAARSRHASAALTARTRVVL